MNAEDLKHLEERLPAIQKAARRHALAHEDPDDIASEMVMQAIRLKADVRNTLADQHLKRRAIDARRRLYRRDDWKPRARIHEEKLPAPAQLTFDREEEAQEAEELMEWMSEQVDTGEPIRREIAARDALGGLPLLLEEKLALVLETRETWESSKARWTRGELIKRKRLRKNSQALG